MQPSNRAVVVTGIGVITPIGIGKQAFVEGLRGGRSGVGPISQFDTSSYRHKLAAEIKDFCPAQYFDRKDLRRMDRASQMALVAAREAVEDAKLDFSNEDTLRCGVILGTTLGGMVSGERYHRLLLQNKRRVSLLFDFPAHAAVDRIATAYHFRGPTCVFSTACASGGHSIGFGCDLIRSGRADIVLAGGVDPLSQFTVAGFGCLQTLIKDDDRVRPFDKNRRGFVTGEGAAILVLESSEHAKSRSAVVYGEVCGYGMSSDAYHMTAPDKEGKGAAKAMSGALKQAGMSTSAVDYINAHGTATKYNDAMETVAIKKVFGEHAYKLAVSSTKSMIGHTLGAAGSIELAATMLAMKMNFLPPTINFETSDPLCDLDYIPNKPSYRNARVALSNSFGFGGANISVLVKTA